VQQASWHNCPEPDPELALPPGREFEYVSNIKNYRETSITKSVSLLELHYTTLWKVIAAWKIDSCIVIL